MFSYFTVPRNMSFKLSFPQALSHKKPFSIIRTTHTPLYSLGKNKGRLIHIPTILRYHRPQASQSPNLRFQSTDVGGRATQGDKEEYSRVLGNTAEKKQEVGKWQALSIFGKIILCGVVIAGAMLKPSSALAARNRSKLPDMGVRSALAMEDRDVDEEEAQEDKRAMRRGGGLSSEQRISIKKKKENKPPKLGKKIDVLKSVVPNPDDIPADNDERIKRLISKWRIDKLKDVTYTQFWQLVREGHVEEVSYSYDYRSVKVKLKNSAPGGARTVKVGLAYDPELYDHLLAHDVFINVPKGNMFDMIMSYILTMSFPLLIAYCLVNVAFRIGEEEEADEIFGGANLDMMSSKKSRISFKDIAGIDEVKDEVREIVAFLKNPKRFLDLGARSPGGILLVGPPGSGKTLFAKALAGEAGVPFFSTAGTEFMEMYVGVGASRVRDMFEKARQAAPCILFIDEFDGVGQQRTYDSGGDESVHTVNQLLTELDGFEDNTGLIVMAATNRPNALDRALTRPGRFDRIIRLPLPNLDGRADILRVHLRGIQVSDDVDLRRIARASAGFSGADLMHLVNQAATFAARQRKKIVEEMDFFEALEDVYIERGNKKIGAQKYDFDAVTPMMRKSFAVYESAKALIGYITPYYDDIFRVSVCPNGTPIASTFFVPREDRLESKVVTKGIMESKIVVCMAGRCAERLVLGDSYISTAGASDINHANAIAREMVYRCGFSQRIGPVAMLDNEDYLRADIHKTRVAANVSVQLGRVAFEECKEIIDSAEAKAYYGLATNFPALEALINYMIENEQINSKKLTELMTEYNAQPFESQDLQGYGWTKDGRLIYPTENVYNAHYRADEEKEMVPANAESQKSGTGEPDKSAGYKSWWDPANPYNMKWDLPDVFAQDYSDSGEL